MKIYMADLGRLFYLLVEKATYFGLLVLSIPKTLWCAVIHRKYHYFWNIGYVGSHIMRCDRCGRKFGRRILVSRDSL